MSTFFVRARGRLVSLVNSFGITEKILFFLFLSTGIICLLSYAYLLNQKYMVHIPRHGGSFTEGFVGIPRFINPVLATTDTDKELTTLVYTGLTRPNDKGEFIPALANEYKVSDDGTIYTFTLRDDIEFHDGTKITAEDVAFTVRMVQDPAVKSPRRAQWEGVAVTTIDDRHVEFTLKQPYSAFLTSTNLGILPKHLWQDVTAEQFPYSNLNLNPIGAGPYKIKDVKLREGGLVERIIFRSNEDFVLGKPYINKIEARFFGSEKDRIAALDNGDIDSASNLSEETALELRSKGFNLAESPLNRLFGVFFNQNQSPVLLNHEVREALSKAVNKEALVDEVLDGFGTPIDSPIPEFSSLFSSISSESTNSAPNIEAILSELAKDGWAKNSDGILEKKTKSGSEKLIFSIYTSDNEDLKETAKKVSEMWNQIGAIVDVKVFESAQFNLGVLRPRKYDAILFGITVGRDLDYYAFWHSSQRNDPGLNIALYTNSKADKLLSSARTELDPSLRSAAEEAFALEVVRDVPAVFLYSPHFIYALPPKIQGYDAKSLRAPGDRFYDVHKWYIETDTVWKIFTN